MKNQIFRTLCQKTNASEQLWKICKENATIDEIREAAARICADYLSGKWKQVNANELTVKRISGGLSNFLYYISLPTSVNDELSTLDDKNSNTIETSDAGDRNSKKRQRNNSDDNKSAISNSIIKLQQQQENQRLQRQQSQDADQLQQQPQEVLLRIYGQSHGDDGFEAIITETVVVALLSERNFGPKLHGIFPGGRLEEYVTGARALLTSELAIPKLSLRIAEKMGEIHSLEIPMSKEPYWFWNTMGRWMQNLQNILKSSDWKGNEEEYKIVNEFNYEEESKWMKSIIERRNYPVLFCHNDLQEGNILLKEKEINDEETAKIKRKCLDTNDNANANADAEANANDMAQTSKSAAKAKTLDVAHDDDPEIMIIDFEYCAYNYRGFDLANHFLEWTFDYTNPEYPNFWYKIQNYPTKQQREAFIRTYLKKLNENIADYESTDDELKGIEEEVLMFSMFSHLFWSLWSIVYVTSNIEFGYWEYGVVRLREYQRLKQLYLERSKTGQLTID